MRRKKVVVGVLATVLVCAAAAWVVQRMANRKPLNFNGTRLVVDLAQPDALIRSQALSALPRDVLKVPMARAVLTEELAFYYDQHEDRLGLSGAIKRIAYEHELEWSDKILETVFNEPAELAFWRDGKGALRHYALVMRRNALAKVLQQAALVAASDSQLKVAGEIGSFGHKASVLALEINPRRTLLLITRGDSMVVLSDPGLLFDSDNKAVSASAAAVSEWLENEGALSRQFRLDAGSLSSSPAGKNRPGHTLAIGSTSLTLGYGALLPGIKGLRFDYHGTSNGSWSSAVWLDGTRLAATGLGDAAVWRAAPAAPGACLLLPVDWRAAQKIVLDADKQPLLPASDSLASLAGLDGAALACWYRESTLYTPVFISRLRKPVANRRATLELLATWAVKNGGTAEAGGLAHDSAHGSTQNAAQSSAPSPAKANAASANAGKAASNGGPDDYLLWQASSNGATLAAQGEYLVFSPDRNLVKRTLETIARRRASIADQMSTSDATMGVLMPRPLAAMFEHEMMAALTQVGNEDLMAAAKRHLPPKMQALAAFAPLQLQVQGAGRNDWQPLEWKVEKRP